MALTKRALLASGATLAFASAVRAEGTEPFDLKDRQCFVLDPTGKGRVAKLSAVGDAAMRKYGKEFSTRAMFYRTGDRQYVVMDRRMTDGSMLFDRAGSWQSGA